jgi:hypothetical protein
MGSIGVFTAALLLRKASLGEAVDLVRESFGHEEFRQFN